MLAAMVTSLRDGAPAYEGEEVGLVVSHLRGRQQLALHLAEHLERKHFV